jgi:hypothetical protein
VDRKALDDLSKKLTDQGKLIEAGWIGCRIMWVPKDAPEVQVTEMRRAYMAGAQHLFASIMGILDPGTEPTAKDLARMDLIHTELEAFRRSLQN